MNTVGDPSWLEQRSKSGAVHQGDAAVLNVNVSGGPDGSVAYHVVLETGQRPRFEPGSHGRGAQATLEMTWADAHPDADADGGGLNLVVAYMQGTAKSIGATRPLYDLFLALHRGSVQGAST